MIGPPSLPSMVGEAASLIVLLHDSLVVFPEMVAVCGDSYSPPFPTTLGASVTHSTSPPLVTNCSELLSVTPSFSQGALQPVGSEPATLRCTPSEFFFAHAGADPTLATNTTAEQM